jgi:hypothetical protein
MRPGSGLSPFPFRARGGYKQVHIEGVGHEAKEEPQIHRCSRLVREITRWSERRDSNPGDRASWSSAKLRQACCANSFKPPSPLTTPTWSAVYGAWGRVCCWLKLTAGEIFQIG